MATVTVGCKHPHGLHLDLTDNSGQVRRITLRGTARRYGEPDHTVGGYALTEVDAEHWNAWLARYKDSPLVTEGIVFAAPTLSDARKEAKVNESVPAMNPPVEAGPGTGVEVATKD